MYFLRQIKDIGICTHPGARVKLQTLKHCLNSSLSQLLHRVFYPFLYIIWSRCHQAFWWSQLWLPRGLFWSQVELAVYNTGAAVACHRIRFCSLLLLKAFFISPIKISIIQLWNNLLLKPCTKRSLAMSCLKKGNISQINFQKQKHNLIFSWTTYIE